jgi:hypothetical protein
VFGLGLFDIFKGKKDGSAKQPADKYAGAAADKRAQPYDRQEALHALSAMGTAESAAALLKRFTFVVDPSITDQEEKDISFQGILKAGQDAIGPVRKFAEKAESLAWPMRILKQLLSKEEVAEELIQWLAKWDVDYAKFIDPKIQILAALEEYQSESVLKAVLPFLEDANETARFHAVATILAQKDASALLPLLEAFIGEESVRVRAKIAEGCRELGWTVVQEKLDAVRKALPDAFNLDGQGAFTKR